MQVLYKTQSYQYAPLTPHYAFLVHAFAIQEVHHLI